jgi:hypothetical protein
MTAIATSPVPCAIIDKHDRGDFNSKGDLWTSQLHVAWKSREVKQTKYRY